MSEALSRIERRARNADTRTDLAAPRDAGVLPPATPEQIAAAEESLDFALPPFLKRIYQEIGNGGFGPGTGLIGLPGGATDEHGNSIIDLFDSFSATNPDDPAWQWPDRVVPLCHWSGAVYSCVDCTTREGAVSTVDLTEYSPGLELKSLFVPQHESLEGWLGAWAEGVDLWQEMFPLELE